jgi:subtilisin family serine protease
MEDSMTRKTLFNVLAVFILVASLLGGFYSTTKTSAAAGIPDIAGKIEPELIEKLNQEGAVDYIVQFAEQADLSAAYKMSWEERGDFVYHTLVETAARSQVRAKGILDKGGFQYQSFFAGNDLYIRLGTLDVATRLADLAEVDTIRATRVYSIAPVESINPIQAVQWAGDLLSLSLNANLDSTDALISWGIVDTKADQFWTAFEVQGDGIIVANIDTGVQYDHPALDQSYACQSNPADPACWLDAIDECVGDLPCDPHGHGTHVMGTMVADDDTTLSYIAGMAPEADWIACKACNDDGNCTDLGLSKCADWILAPGDNPANRPHIVNNSWSYQGGNSWFLPKVEAWRASGIFPSFVAGNFGSACATIGSPGDYQESFATAAHDPARTIAWFSGRGPSDFGHDPYTKPNISAPGTEIWSTVPNNTWGMTSGTSQAAPHSAGAVALLWSCNPALVGEIDMTYQILHYTANTTPAGTCGAPPDGQGNYTYGYGYLDVLEAGNDYCGLVDYGTVEGYVFDNRGVPVEGVSISAAPSIQSAGIQSVTDPAGYYSMDLLVGTYDLTAYHPDYIMESISDIEVIKDTVTHAPAFILDYLGKWVEHEKFPGCPDWTRYDGEYFPGDGKIYFLGGRSSTSTIADIYAFDLGLGQCSDTGADMAIGISNYTIVPLEVMGKELLCTFGGRDSTGVNTNQVQCYDPIANTVIQPTTLPSSVATYIPGGAVNVENKAYIFGGLAYAAPYETAETWKWDPEVNLWTKLDDMVKGVSYPQFAVVDDVIYSFGGTIFNPLRPKNCSSFRPSARILG